MHPEHEHARLPLSRASMFLVPAGALERLGGPVEASAHRAGVSTRWLEATGDRLMPMSGLYRFLEVTSREIDGFGGLAPAQAMDLSGRFSRILRSGLTVHDALCRFCAHSLGWGTSTANISFRIARAAGSGSPDIGAYGLIVSGDLKGQLIVGQLVRSESGVEVFYNSAITPWLQVSADVQWVSSGIDAGGDAMVAGTRLFAQFQPPRPGRENLARIARTAPQEAGRLAYRPRPVRLERCVRRGPAFGLRIRG